MTDQDLDMKYVVEEIQKRRRKNLFSGPDDDSASMESPAGAFKNILETFDACDVGTIKQMFEDDYDNWSVPDPCWERTWVMSPDLRVKVKKEINTWIIHQSDIPNGYGDFWRTLEHMVHDIVDHTQNDIEDGITTMNSEQSKIFDSWKKARDEMRKLQADLKQSGINMERYDDVA